ncbi:protein SERAC1-like isoform X1 [Tachypleus tridentatus]|uniref:protein SERAC1-like isoform X1 n=1 Tax=Tachypleus tridentatus TaxID=6853 RepID=UPI003FD144EE
MPFIKKVNTSQRSFRVFRKKGLVAGCVAFLIGGGYLAREAYQTGGNLRLLFGPVHPQSASTKVGTDSTTNYIYLPDATTGPAKDNSSLKWLPWRKSDKRLHWRLLKLAQSKDKQVRHIAIRALVELPGLQDADYQEIAQACDLQTAVGLARTRGVDLRFFLPPPPLPSEFTKNSVESDLRVLLASLPQSGVGLCVQYFTQNAVKPKYYQMDLDSGGEWCFGGEGLAEEVHQAGQHTRRVPAETVECFCLQALVSHSTVPSHRKAIIQKGGLQLLHRIRLRRSQNPEIQSLIGQILGNLSLEKEIHRHLLVSGWIGVLASWIKSPRIEVSLPASRALANMDKDKILDVLYEDQVYLLFPQLREKNKQIYADIVFIHGLLGGAFKTWRQNDSKNVTSEKNQSKKISVKSSDDANTWQHKPVFHASFGLLDDAMNFIDYTQCWPKDWLSREFPHSRILAVDYVSHLSDWQAKCPLEKEKRSLLVRSEEILRNMTLAGVGERPLVWVCHSMGGLLVKQMLLLAAKSDDPSLKSILKNTVGVVFYSVPHKGTDMASLKPSVQFLFLPSVEVQELKKNSPQLLKLHEDFSKLAEERKIACLSFGETKKTRLGLRWSKVLVPVEGADPGFGQFITVDASHLDTCKPESRDSPTYILLVQFLHNHLPHTLLEQLIVEPVPSPKELETMVIMGLVQ